MTKLIRRWRLNHCRSSGTTGTSGGAQGGSTRGANGRSTCPDCGKSIVITKAGRFRVHGVRIEVTT